MRRRSGLGRNALIGIVAVILLLVIAGVFAVLYSGSKTTGTSTTTSSTSSRSSSTTSTAAVSSAVAAYNLSSPIGVAFNQANGDLYVTNNFTNTVSVINVASDKLVTTIPVGIGPAAIAIDPNNGYLYVTNNGSSTVSAIDGSSNKVVKTINTQGQRPDGIAFDPVNNCLYVAEHGISIPDAGGAGADITVINATSNTLIRGLTGIDTPTAVAYDSKNGDIYVTTGGVTVQVIDPANNTMIEQIQVGIEPRGIVFDPDNGNLYVSNFASGTISVINGSSNKVIGSTINVSASIASSPYLMAYNSAKGYIMVTNNVRQGVNIINATTNTYVTTVSTGVESGPTGIVYDPVNGITYVATFDTNAVVAISPTLTASYFANPTVGVTTATHM